MPCMCGDAECPSCGRAQGTYTGGKMSKRFQTMLIGDAHTAGYPVEGFVPGDWYSCIVDTANNSVIGYDGGEPEDQTLCRDWSWVVEALNDVAEESVKLRDA